MAKPFQGAVECHRVAAGEQDYPAIWALLEPLATDHAPDSLKRALVGSRAADPSERAVAFDLMGLLAGFHPSHRKVVVRRIVERSKVEQDQDVRWSLAMAAGHARDPRVLPALALLSDSGDPDVRFQVAQAAGATADRSTKDGAARLLIKLSCDSDEGVRMKASESLALIARITD